MGGRGHALSPISMLLSQSSIISTLSPILILMENSDLHDSLLANLPEGATHEAESCPFCNPEGAVAASTNTDGTPKGGDMSDTTYTQEDLDSAVAEAVATATGPLAEELADLKAAASEEQINTRIAEVRAELQAQVDQATAESTTAAAEAAQAKEAHDNLVTYLEALKAEAEAQEEQARVKTERLDKIKEVASFKDEYVEANAERWAAMDEDAFSAMVEALESAKPDAPAAPTSSLLANATAMTASSDTPTRTEAGSAIGEVFDLVVAGTSVSNL